MAIVAMNVNLSRSSAHLTLSQISQQNVKTVAELLTFDITKIGYGYDNPIITAEEKKLTFKSDIDNDGSIETVKWVFDDSGSEPHMYRYVNSAPQEITVGVVDFEFVYKNENNGLFGTVFSSIDDIRQIQIKLTVRSKEKLGSFNNPDGEFIKSVWQKTFTPKNLTF